MVVAMIKRLLSRHSGQLQRILAALVLILFAVLQIRPSFQLNGYLQVDNNDQDEVQVHTQAVTQTRAEQTTAVPSAASDSAKSSTTRATFLGINLTYTNAPKPSVVHCVGENFLPKTSQGYRSCQFRQLCWDFATTEFVIYESPQQQKWTRSLEELFDVSSAYVQSSSNFYNTTVSTRPTNEGLLKQGKDPGWFPRSISITSNQEEGYYELPDDMVLIPVTLPPDGTTSRKDILFDFLLPIYNLLAMFGLQQGNKRVLLANLGGRRSSKILQELLPLILNQDPNLQHTIFHTHESSDMDIQRGDQNSGNHQTNQHSIDGKRICASFGAAGIGALTDHGVHKKSHGERKKDYTFVQNSGRGPLLWDFRNHLLKNVGLSSLHDKRNINLPLKISVMISESKRSGIQHFQTQIDAIKTTFSNHQVQVQSYDMTNLTFQEQIKVALHDTDIYITMMGEGALPAFFLPRDATLIQYVNNKPNVNRGEFVSTGTTQDASFPIKLDWDLWNNLSYLRVHWLPLWTGATNETGHQDLLLAIVELAIRQVEDEKNEEEVEDTRRRQSTSEAADGTFNGINVRLVNGTTNQASSTVHCVGDNFQEEAHVFRSCDYGYLCLDLERQDFFINLPSSPSLLDRATDKKTSAWISTSGTNVAVSVGHTVRFSGVDSAWSPRVVCSKGPMQVFYELPPDTVWLPFYAEQPNIHNPGHLLWDYFLPFYNLLAMFGLDNADASKMLVTNLGDGCTQEEDSPCWGLLNKFLPLLGVNSSTFRTTRQSKLTTSGPRQSNLVCARHGVAGIGMLTDHGWNRHGQRIEDYRDSHNVGRGPLAFAFRNFVLQNMGIGETRIQQPYKIVFSTRSSKNPARRHSFQRQIDALRDAFSNEEISVEHHILAKLSIREQVELATQTAVFVSVVGGSASTATFLPRGSSVILFFDDANEFVDRSSRKDFPCMIDWDLWNNAAHLRVHWLPIKTMNETANQNALVELVRNEIATLQYMQ